MISVVLPIYNVEKFLNKSIESMLNQTYKDFELLLVDDGSPDNCHAICDEWEKKEQKIRVFHKQNGGVSTARNCGIENAKGEYILFPDPDDWVEPEYLEKLLENKEKYNADISICGHYHGNRVNNPKAELTEMDTDEALEQLMMPDSFCGFAWNKLYNMDIIKKNNLRFDVELGMVQDLHFNVRYFQYCKKVVYDPSPVYHYTVDNGGVTSRYTPLTPRKISGLLTYKKIAEITHDKYPKLEAIAYSSLCKMCLDDMIIYYKSGMKDKKVLKILKKDFVKYRKIFYKSDAYTVRDKRFSRFAVIHPKFYCCARRLYWHIICPQKTITDK